MLPYLVRMHDGAHSDHAQMYMLHDVNERVRAHALNRLTIVLENIRQLSREDCRIFVDYLLPDRLVCQPFFYLTIGVTVQASLPRDTSSLVRISLAANLGRLARTATRYFDLSLEHYAQSDPETMPIAGADNGGSVPSSPGSVPSNQQQFVCVLRSSRCSTMQVRRENRALRDFFVEMVVCLLGDVDNAIRQTLVLGDGLLLLCQFFGKQKSRPDAHRLPALL
jgi:hypothetical protein